MAGLGEIATLAGPSAYETPLLPINPRQWLLWGVLILAVLVLLWIAWRLIRETGTSPRDAP